MIKRVPVPKWDFQYFSWYCEYMLRIPKLMCQSDNQFPRNSCFFLFSQNPRHTTKKYYITVKMGVPDPEIEPSSKELHLFVGHWHEHIWAHLTVFLLSPADLFEDRGQFFCHERGIKWRQLVTQLWNRIQTQLHRNVLLQFKALYEWNNPHNDQKNS